MDVSRAGTEALKVWLAGGGLLLFLLWWRLPKSWTASALLALTVIAGVNYERWGSSSFQKDVDSYDIIHYYLGSKYFDELGYYDLYPALILADSEHPKGPFTRKARTYRAQDAEHGYRGGRPIREGLAAGREIKKRFSPEDWQEFRTDFWHLQRDFSMTGSYYRTMLDDRGFNGTPVWTMLAQPLSKSIPVRFIHALCKIDILLLLLALWGLYWAYEDETVPLACAFFLFVTYSLRWPVPGQAFLRYDWCALLLFSMALLRKGRFAWAGALSGVAALLRFFPAGWMFGPAAQAAFQLITKRTPGPASAPARSRIHPELLKMGAAFLCTLLILEGMASFHLGWDAIVTHAANIAEHSTPEELSSRRMGFRIAYMYEGQFVPKIITSDLKQLVAEQTTTTRILAAALLVALGFGVKRLRTDESFALGFVPFFLLATFSYYYAVARITLIVFHASDLTKLRNRVGLAFLLGTEAMSNFIQTQYDGHRLFLIGTLSWALTLYSVGLIAWLVWEQRAATPLPEPSPESTAAGEEPEPPAETQQLHTN